MFGVPPSGGITHQGFRLKAVLQTSLPNRLKFCLGMFAGNSIQKDASTGQ
jgi:hypothetical protein